MYGSSVCLSVRHCHLGDVRRRLGRQIKMSSSPLSRRCRRLLRRSRMTTSNGTCSKISRCAWWPLLRVSADLIDQSDASRTGPIDASSTGPPNQWASSSVHVSDRYLRKFTARIWCNLDFVRIGSRQSLQNAQRQMQRRCNAYCLDNTQTLRSLLIRTALAFQQSKSGDNLGYEQMWEELEVYVKSSRKSLPVFVSATYT